MGKYILSSLGMIAAFALVFVLGGHHDFQHVHQHGQHFGAVGFSGIGLIGLSTNKVVLRTIEEFMTDYVPTYQPIFPLFVNARSQSFAEQVGVINFNRVNTIGDIRGKHITPKDTEIRQISFNEGKKTFKKYFLGNQFQISELQDQNSVEDVIKQVLDEYGKQADDMLLLGEGTAANNVVNNGLYWSGDANYVLENSVAIAAGTDRLIDFQAQVATSKIKADLVAGRKTIMFYGSTILPLFNGVYAANPVAFKKVLADTLGPNYSTMEMPADVTPAGANGWIVVNWDNIKLNYTKMPTLQKQGVNDEKSYAWFNFLMGSMMLEVTASKAIIRQPATLA